MTTMAIKATTKNVSDFLKIITADGFIFVNYFYRTRYIIDFIWDWTMLPHLEVLLYFGVLFSKAETEIDNSFPLVLSPISVISIP